MKTPWAALSAMAVVLSQATLPAATAPARAEFVPERSEAVLFNPGMGLYLQYPPLDATADEWFMSLCDIAYYRLDWSELQPEPEESRFDAYFGPRFDAWVTRHGKRVAFRVMCQNMNSANAYVTPKWVFDRGVPGVSHRAIRGQMQTDPAFWDERYLEQHLPFIRQLGAYLDGRPGLEFVDIGSIGEWGEMHLARWTAEQLEATGFSERRYIEAYRRVIDAFAEAFPRTRVFLNVGGQTHHTINDYAALRGLHFRQDGLGPRGASYACETWLYPPYARRGVICNLEFHSSHAEMQRRGWDLPTTLEKALASPVSYLNTNLFGGDGYRQAPAEARQRLAEAGRRLGYRIVLTRLEHPTTLRLAPGRPTRVHLRTTWTNEGVAPCYASYALDWSLLDAAGTEVLAERVYPVAPTTQWWPGEEQTVALALRLPSGFPPGEYRLAVALADPETGQRLQLGLAGRDAAGRYGLCRLPTEAVAAETAAPFVEDFEGEPQATWQGSAGITAAVVETAAHGGRHALRVSGACRNAWNYAAAPLPAALPPGSRVRLSAWVRVSQLAGSRRGPYLKIGVNAADGAWLTNLNTATYDLGQLDTWQLLQGSGEIPLEAGRFDLALERGELDAETAVDLCLDDLQIEILEAP